MVINMRTKKVEDTKKIFSKSHTLLNTFDLRDFKGKKVLAKNGLKVGKVSDFVIDKSYNIVSLKVRNWFRTFYVDTLFIDSLSNKVVKLNIIPVVTNIGKKVFDVEGRYVGKVVGLVKTNDKNEFKGLIVKKRFFFRGKTINKSDIKTNDKNIILKIEHVN